MSETWAKDGERARQDSVDLHLDLPGPKSPKGVRLGLETALRDSVRTRPRSRHAVAILAQAPWPPIWS
jgi:hypothetical protein